MCGRVLRALVGFGVVMSVLLAPLPALADVPKPEDVCAVADSRLAEVSGLVAHAGGWYAVPDGGTEVEIFSLGRDCSVRDVIQNPTNPYDVEDMARAPDGTLWLGDTGDNRKRRDTVALHAVSPDGTAVLYRLTYPDGAHDAEALLLGRDGTPYIITKNVLGNSDVYRPTGPMASPGPTPLERVGRLQVEATDTPGGPIGKAGSLLVTGAATSPDGRVIAVRTYTDAYLYPVGDGGIVSALQRDPVRVPLPNEPQGEAIAFDRDGTLLSASEGQPAPIRAVPGAAGLVADAPGPAPAAAPGKDAADEGAADNGAAVGATGQDRSPGVPVLPGIAIAVTVAAVLVFGVSRLRRR